MFSFREILVHIPGLVNVYGHLHEKAKNDSPNRFCCSVEQTEYRPISIEEIEKYLTKCVPF